MCTPMTFLFLTPKIPRKSNFPKDTETESTLGRTRRRSGSSLQFELERRAESRLVFVCVIPTRTPARHQITNKEPEPRKTVRARCSHTI